MDRLAARAVPLFVLAGIGFADGFDLNRTANLETGSVVGKALRPDVDGRPGAAFVKVSGSGTNLARVGDTDGAFVVGGLPGGRLDLRLFDDVDGDGELLDELDAGHHQLVPPANGSLHAVPDLAVTVLGQPAQSERAPGSVPAEALEASSIVFVQVRPGSLHRGTAFAKQTASQGVQGEAVEERLESSSWPGVDRLTTPLERLRRQSVERADSEVVRAPLEVPCHAPRHAPNDHREQSLDVVVGGRRKADERGALLVRCRDLEDPVRHHGVEVDVERQVRSKAVHKRDGSRLRRREALLLGRQAVEARERAVPDGEHRRCQSRFPSQREAQSARERQDPLPDRHDGEDLVHEMCRALSRAPSRARWADPAALARERDQDLVTAGSALDTGEAMCSNATAQEGPQLVVDEARYAKAVLRSLARLGQESLEVLADDFVQDGLLRKARDVAGWEGSRNHRRIAPTPRPRSSISMKLAGFVVGRSVLQSR